MHLGLPPEPRPTYSGPALPSQAPPSPSRDAPSPAQPTQDLLSPFRLRPVHRGPTARPAPTPTLPSPLSPASNLPSPYPAPPSPAQVPTSPAFPSSPLAIASPVQPPLAPLPALPRPFPEAGPWPLGAPRWEAGWALGPPGLSSSRAVITANSACADPVYPSPQSAGPPWNLPNPGSPWSRSPELTKAKYCPFKHAPHHPVYICYI